LRSAAGWLEWVGVGMVGHANKVRRWGKLCKGASLEPASTYGMANGPEQGLQLELLR